MKQQTLRNYLSTHSQLVAVLTFTIFFTVGFVGHILSFSHTMMISFTPIFLFVFGALSLIPVVLEKRKGVFFWALVTLIVTFFLEALGTATGRIFGPYTYGATLGVKVLAVPVVIAFNWLIVIIAGLTVARLVTSNGILGSVITAAFALGFDYILEPVAIRLDYWTWQWNGIPLQNYLAWFLIALASAFFFNLFKLKIETKIPLYYVLHQVVFFLLLRPALS